MNSHPEMPTEINELIDEMEKTEIGLVHCHGCNAQRVINAVYLPYVRDTGIESCRFCRQ